MGKTKKPSAAYFKNGVGNLVMMTPALQAFKTVHDGAPLHVFIDRETDTESHWEEDRKRACSDILQALPFVERVVEWPDPKVNPEDYQAWWASPHGEKGATWDLFMEHGAMDGIKPQDWFHKREHEVEHYLGAVMARFGWILEAPPLVFPRGNGAWVDGKGPMIGLCNSHYHGDPVWKKRRWPHYAGLAESIIRFFGGTPVCLGGSEDRWWLDALDERGVEYKDHVGTESIIGTGDIIAGLDVLVTTDTAAMHIAAAHQIPTVFLCGPSSEAKNGPWRVRHATVRGLVPCVGCRQRRNELWECKEDYPAKCMASISEGMVMAAIRGLL